jgi:hypothetical protein
VRRRTPAQAGLSETLPAGCRQGLVYTSRAPGRRTLGGAKGTRPLSLRRQVADHRPVFVNPCSVCLSLTRPLGNRLPRSPRPRDLSGLTNHDDDGVREAWPGTQTLGGHCRGGCPVCLGLGPCSARSRIAGPARPGTAPDSAESMYLGPPKPHDARSVALDAAPRTSPRPGRALHELIRAARASHRIAGSGHCRGEQPCPPE